MNFFNTDSLMLFLAQETAKKGGFLSTKVILIVVGLLIVLGGVYWFRSRGAK